MVKAARHSLYFIITVFIVLWITQCCLAAITTANSARTQGDTIVNETVGGANTAARVGGAIRAQLDAAILTVNAATATVGFTAAAGELYPTDTLTTGAFTVIIPGSPTADDIIGFVDVKSNWAAANVIVDFTTNTQKLHGTVQNLVLDLDDASARVRYINSTIGWIIAQ